jgi:hypothetical protein
MEYLVERIRQFLALLGRNLIQFPVGVCPDGYRLNHDLGVRN